MFVFLWLTSLSVIISTFTHVSANGIAPSLFMANIPLCAGVGFPGGLDGKASACNAGDLGSIPGLERSPGEGNGSPLQYSCLEDPMDGGAC